MHIRFYEWCTNILRLKLHFQVLPKKLTTNESLMAAENIDLWFFGRLNFFYFLLVNPERFLSRNCTRRGVPGERRENRDFSVGGHKYSKFAGRSFWPDKVSENVVVPFDYIENTTLKTTGRGWECFKTMIFI